MISLRELATALFGVWRLAHLDTNGLQYLDDSIAGFWNSFTAALIVLPGYLIVQMLGMSVRLESVAAGEIDINWARVFLVWLTVYVMHWTLFPIAAAYITAEIGRSEAYMRLIVALNWANVIQIAIIVPSTALLVLSGGTGPGGMFLFLIINLALLFYSWFITRTALDVPGLIAIGLVGLNLLLSLALNTMTDFMTGF